MGSQSVQVIQTKEERKTFLRQFLIDVQALTKMLDEDRFEKGVFRVGAEQEVCLVNTHYTPAYTALAILEQVHDAHFTTELGLFNLEINLDPYELVGACFSKLEAQLHSFYQHLDKTAHDTQGTKPILVGILPTLRIKDLDFKYITPYKRYKTLNKVLKAIRGEDFNLHIQGVDELRLKHDSILFEACNTSFQVHLQVEAKDVVTKYNWSQAIAGPLLSVMTNSPLLLGKELWSETRIALFQQSIDMRTTAHLSREQQPRVTFGKDWIYHSATEIFMDDIARYSPLVTTDFEENAMASLADGIMPKLTALNLHNGTLYKWNRLCYGVHKNVAHLRIENRYIPSGPSVIDEVANAMLWIGVMQGMPESYAEFWKTMPFLEAKGNFVNAARTGLDTWFQWFGKEVSAEELLTKTLLPMAKNGLLALGISTSDIEKYLHVIEARIQTKNTGSKWMIRNKRHLRTVFSTHETNIRITEKMYEYQRQNKPVHQWEDISLVQEAKQYTNNKAYKIMSRELFVVEQDDPLDVITHLMQWKNIHHLPVVDKKQKIIGVISAQNIANMNSNEDWENISAKDIMDTHIHRIHPEATLEEMNTVMQTYHATILIVYFREQCIGIVTQNDLQKIRNS